MAIPVPFVAPYVNVVSDYAAISNDSTAEARAANSRAFKEVQNDMPNGPLGHPVFVPSGVFYLAESLRIEKSLQLFGTGIRGESALMFPPGASLIVERSTNEHPEVTGADCVIRDIRLESDESWLWGNPSTIDLTTFKGPSAGTPGIRLQSTAYLERVYITGFTGTAVEIVADATSQLATNANQWRAHDLYIRCVGGHGLHTSSGDANGGFCSGAKIFAVGGNGIYDSSEGGSTYVGCYVEVAMGRGYHAENDEGATGQVTFVGCFAEVDTPSRIGPGGAVWIGGTSSGFSVDTQAFIADSFGDVHPFEVRNQKNVDLRLLLGYLGDEGDLLGWQAKDGADFWLIRWDAAKELWRLENGAVGAGSAVATYYTGTGNPRGAFHQGFPELLLGDEDSPMRITRGTAPKDSGEGGDIVYNKDPQVGDYVGWVWVNAAAGWKPFGKIDEPAG